VTSIASYAFFGCDSLKTVTSLNPVPPTLDADVFENSPVEAVYVPICAVADYEAADKWNEFNIFGLEQTGIENIIFGSNEADDSAAEHATVYTLQGLCVKDVRTMDDVKFLTPGLYIVNGKKMRVK
jgi:hypothetical protein